MTRMVKPSAIAKGLGVSVCTVRRLIASRRLRAIDVGDGRGRPTYRVLASSARAYLSQRGLTDSEIAEILAA